jgi:hypothetical protein
VTDVPAGTWVGPSKEIVRATGPVAGDVELELGLGVADGFGEPDGLPDFLPLGCEADIDPDGVGLDPVVPDEWPAGGVVVDDDPPWPPVAEVGWVSGTPMEWNAT